MPEIRSLTRQVPTEAVIELGEDSVRLVFDRNGVTPRLLADMQQRLESGDVTAVAKMLETLIIEWDVTDEGQAFPASAENIARLSVSALASLSRRIGDEAVPASEEGNASVTTSSSPSGDSFSTPASPQNGPQPSPSPTPSAVPPTR